MCNMMKILFSLLMVVASLMFIEAFPQNDLNPESGEIVQADGFVFDGPASRPFGVTQRSSTTQTTNTNMNNRNTNANTNTMIPILQFDQCVTSCPVTPEYNPVCGSDSIDYTNPGGLGCAQRCGKDVTLLYYGRCSTG